MPLSRRRIYRGCLSLIGACARARYRVMRRRTECHCVFVRLHRGSGVDGGATRVKPDEVWQRNLIKPPMDIVPASNPIPDARPRVHIGCNCLICM